jgi:hypothetical protein
MEAERELVEVSGGFFSKGWFGGVPVIGRGVTPAEAEADFEVVLATMKRARARWADLSTLRGPTDEG